MELEKWIVEPTIGVDRIRFGMSRSEICSVLGEPKRQFKKTKFSESLTDDFGSFHVFYNKDDRCEAIEIFEGIQVMVNGETLFPQAADIVKSCPIVFTDEEDGFYSVEYSIGFYAPHGKIESITIAEKGYY